MVHGPINLSLFGSKVARGPQTVFLFFWCFFRIKKCLETDFTVKVNVKKQRRLDRSTVTFKFMDKVLTNAHSFCTGDGVAISGLSCFGMAGVSPFEESKISIETSSFC